MLKAEFKILYTQNPSPTKNKKEKKNAKNLKKSK